MKTLIMVGAGASCAGPGIIRQLNSSPALASGNPPLGGQLLATLQSVFPGDWDESIEKYFQRDPTDFEAGMAQMYEALWTHGSAEQRSKFNWCMFHLTEYFTNWHIIDESCLYVRLINQLRDWRVLSATGDNPNLAFVSLNYERLLEEAIMRSEEILVTFQSRDHPSFSNRVPVWKPHGSCHFAASAKEGTIGYPTPSDLDGGLKPMRREELSMRLGMISEQLAVGSVDPFPIVMSLYMMNKPTMVGQEVIRSIRERYLESVGEADLLVMIGVRPVWSDNHLFDPILARSGPTLFVGYDSEELQEFTERSHGEVTHVARTFAEMVDGELLKPWLEPGA